MKNSEIKKVIVEAVLSFLNGTKVNDSKKIRKSHLKKSMSDVEKILQELKNS